MRTYLLRTVYSPIPAGDLETDTGSACNDAAYVSEGNSPAAKVKIDKIDAAAHTDAENDDYYLGGYAGI